jgi:hypothetical protein
LVSAKDTTWLEADVAARILFSPTTEQAEASTPPARLGMKVDACQGFKTDEELLHFAKY